MINKLADVMVGPSKGLKDSYLNEVAIFFCCFRIITRYIGRIFSERSWVEMPKRKDDKNMNPTFAPGIDDQEELEQSATNVEVEKGEYTSVTTLSYDEVEPS